MPSVLFILTSANKTVTGNQTGYYLPEAAHPYWVLEPHVKIDFASPKGPNPPIDASSIKDFGKDEGCIRYLNDQTVKEKLAHTKKLSEVNVADYDAIFYVGGLGPVQDLPVDPLNAKLASQASVEPSEKTGSVLTTSSQHYQAGKITAAVCHGPAALVGAVDASGKSIFQSKNFTGFSNTEEELADKTKEVPFSLEDKIQELGGKFSKASEPWAASRFRLVPSFTDLLSHLQSHVVVDGILITGQNPGSAHATGEAILKALKRNLK
ncbi:hypothetical protein DXG03_002897 [Asterophora parasitica]|uniref:D-lactate dehydratase n=1 Tax=Asterophora parasitica TaxID=117018 RepID=A0A9P7GDA8_9AGAR|nr:hypothetical protein DXG03_002897 [Asterophora parasitica]